MWFFIKLLISVFLIYKLWKIGHWFFYKNVDENGQDPIDKLIDGVFNRIYEKHEKLVMDRIRKLNKKIK